MIFHWSNNQIQKQQSTLNHTKCHGNPLHNWLFVRKIRHWPTGSVMQSFVFSLLLTRKCWTVGSRCHSLVFIAVSQKKVVENTIGLPSTWVSKCYGLCRCVRSLNDSFFTPRNYSHILHRMQLNLRIMGLTKDTARELFRIVDTTPGIYKINGTGHQNPYKQNGPFAGYVKLRVAHAPGIPGTFYPPTDFKGKRLLAISACITARASRTCHDACRDRLTAVVSLFSCFTPSQITKRATVIFYNMYFDSANLRQA